MMDEHTPESKRQRLAVSKNEAKDIQMKSSVGGVLSLPTGVLGNCFSFLGSSGHYYFLVSVCKDFKVAVDELYGDDRNTSMDSILTSVSTFMHVMNMSENEVNAHLSSKVLDAVFENDRLDLFQAVLLKIDPNISLQEKINAMANAIEYKSTDIMRSIIHENEWIIHLLKNFKPPEGIQVEVGYEDAKLLSESIAGACDPQMIQKLVEKGVAFNDLSITQSLRRKDLETFKCLVDILGHEEVKKQSVIMRTLQHEMYEDAIKYLKQEGYFDNEDVLITAFTCAIRVPAVDINIVKCILEGRRGISDDCLEVILLLCINLECMDILSYIHESIQRIDIDHWIQYAEWKSLDQVVMHLQSMQ